MEEKKKRVNDILWYWLQLTIICHCNLLTDYNNILHLYIANLLIIIPLLQKYKTHPLILSTLNFHQINPVFSLYKFIVINDLLWFFSSTTKWYDKTTKYQVAINMKDVGSDQMVISNRYNYRLLDQLWVSDIHYLQMIYRYIILI